MNVKHSTGVLNSSIKKMFCDKMDGLKAFLYPCDEMYLAISNQRYFH